MLMSPHLRRSLVRSVRGRGTPDGRGWGVAPRQRGESSMTDRKGGITCARKLRRKIPSNGKGEAGSSKTPQGAPQKQGLCLDICQSQRDFPALAAPAHLNPGVLEAAQGAGGHSPIFPTAGITP